jgi:ABC-type sugar transport system ATPase subunit
LDDIIIPHMASIRVVNVSKRFDSAHTPSLRAMYRPAEGSGATLGHSGSDDPPPQGSVMALNGVNLDVHDGESMVILGSSGCGKSTLLRVIAGLESYDGAVYYGGQNMQDVPPKDRGIGIVFQNYALYPQYESKGNLAFFFKMHKRDEEISERVRQTSEIMGIGFNQLLDRKPSTLSGGQKQRVAIARAICRDPKLLLFDEPLSNLDAQLRSSTRIEIRRLINRFRITTLYVTHDQTEATIMGDRMAIMDKGRVVQVGAYRDIYDAPVNAFVAGFLGLPPMNLFAGVVERGGVHTLGTWLSTPPRLSDFAVDGQQVIVGIRPEHMTVCVIETCAPTNQTGAIVASFELAERLPSERIQLLYATIAGERLVVRAPLDQDVPLSRPLALYVDPGAVHLFRADTGMRL